MISLPVFDLRARDRLAPCWLAAALALQAGGALAQRQLPIPPQPKPVSLEVAEPAMAPALSPGAAAAPAAPAVQPKAATASSGVVTIESDLQRADQATGVVTSTGNVRIVYPDQRVVATARQAQYFSKEGRVVLSGDVDIVQEGGNRIRAEQVTYLVNRARLIATPAAAQQVFARVRINATPGSTAAGPSAQPPAR